MPARKYQFRHGWYKKLDAQAVGDFLDALIDERKEYVTPDEILIGAKKKDSPLHEAFTWSDPEAADKCRRSEAKRLVKALLLDKRGEGKTRAFLYVPHPGHGGKRVLMSRQSVNSRPELHDVYITRKVRSMQRQLTSYSELFSEAGTRGLRALSKDLDKLKRRAERELRVGV